MTDEQPPRRPSPARRTPASGIGFSLERDDLLEEARRRTRLDDFAADGAFREGLGLLLHSYRHEAQLKFIGRVAARQETLRLLTNRLRLVEDGRGTPGIAAQKIERPLFLTGLPGSGSHLLHRLFALDEANRVPRHWEILAPSPPPERATYERDPRIALAARQLGWLQRLQPKLRHVDVLDARMPEACGLISAHCFVSSQFQMAYRLPAYQAWLESRDLHGGYRWHRRFLQQLQWSCTRDRWVLRSPGHLFSLAALFATYPDARVVVVHRDPVATTVSLAGLVTLLRRTFSDAVDPTAVGAEVLDRWATAMQRACRFRDAGTVPADRFIDVRHDDLVRDPIGAVRRICALAHIPLGEATVAAMRDFVAATPLPPDRVRDQTLARYGLDQREIRGRYWAYRERFGV